MIPTCLTQFPIELREPILVFASAWAASPLRPRVHPEIEHAWGELIHEWIRTPTLPLFVRKDSARRGPAPIHPSGRVLIPCDNSPAVWAFTQALQGKCPTIAEVAVFFANGEIPVELTKLGKFKAFYEAGWKLAHVEGVGLRTRTPVEKLPLEVIKEHMKRLLSPANHFAIPKRWAGLGEVPEIIEVLSTYDAQVRQDTQRSSDLIAPQKNLLVTAHDLTQPRRVAALRSNSYRATRLLFKSEVIERLDNDQSFRIETPDGTYEMTRAEFLYTFDNVAASSTYRTTGQYSYSTTPVKARRFLV